MPPLDDPRLELFCQERAKAGATDASAYTAGYKAKIAASAARYASRMLGDPKIAFRIAEIQAAALSNNDVTLEGVVRQLARIAFADIRRVLKWGETTVRVHKDEISGERKIVVEPNNEIQLVSVSEMGADTVASIREIRQNSDGSLSVKFHEPMPALILLGKHLGMWSKKSEHLSGRGSTSDASNIKPLVYVDAPPPETAEEWFARHKRRFAELANGT
jgi:phage terminase small subunit